jgi:transketolase
VVKKLTCIGIPDRYIECGSVPLLQQTYGLNTARIIETVAGLLQGSTRA